MGKPVKILDLIKKLFETYKKPEQKLKIKIVEINLMKKFQKGYHLEKLRKQE